MCKGVLCLCGYVHMSTHLYRGQRHWLSWSWSYRQWWAALCECWELDLGPSHNQLVVLTAQSFLQPLSVRFLPSFQWFDLELFYIYVCVCVYIYVYVCMYVCKNINWITKQVIMYWIFGYKGGKKKEKKTTFLCSKTINFLRKEKF